MFNYKRVTEMAKRIIAEGMVEQLIYRVMRENNVKISIPEIDFTKISKEMKIPLEHTYAIVEKQLQDQLVDALGKQFNKLRPSTEVLGKSVDVLELGVRARKGLQRLNIITLKDLTEHTESELLACKNFGQRALDDVKRGLAIFGLKLKEEK